ncbi:diguanylate cyclase domain-containing protein [Arenimonas sp.]|uniref:diguanylate cyclase domain-containing protein n=1 Tax=Arenimonas sp. TaxID=1872635 RepID=UPI002E314C56|nr:diguanylate cyclase [Arenimonas sp.]HEX4854240.1 diguanylate cyclase [Arenimonas sp.]
MSPYRDPAGKRSAWSAILAGGVLATGLAAGLAQATPPPPSARATAPAAAVAPGPAPSAAVDTLDRHPLEIRALVEPEAVLGELGPALISARLASDPREVARLELARANACRVVADWDCQREAGIEARRAAAEAGVPHLAIRGLIAESRARIAMQDYTRSERLLAEAELALKQDPQPELLADVLLAYSSLSYTIGKHALAADYARRGLQVLGESEGLAVRARLLRNLARAQAQLGEVEPARESLVAATRVSQRLEDPKLEAELYLEGARVARIGGDTATQQRNGTRVLEMAEKLRNSQLRGLGHEVLGLAAADAGDGAAATRELLAAQRSFRLLELQSDELRVLRELVRVLLRHDPGSPQLAPLFQRFLSLDNAIAQSERAQAADDFDARLKYAERETEILRLESESALARERSEALAQTNRLGNLLMALGLVALTALAALFWVQRRGHRQLAEAMARLRERELEYRTLADNANDLVLRIGANGERLYVSPSVRDILGIEPGELASPRPDLLHPDDREAVGQLLARVMRDGGTETLRYRARHASGHYIWIEAVVRRVRGADGGQELVYAGRDISIKVRAEQALEATRARLRAVTDNIPAMIAHIDLQERYTFANAVGERLFGHVEGGLVGKTVREIRGEAIYSEIRPHILRALAGERVTYSGETEVRGKHYHYQTSYVPDVRPDGVQQGFFSFTYDITQLKQAEQALETLARKDSLTGLANRRYFDERLGAALARSARQQVPLALLTMDIDHFKGINDGLGHAAGDEVLREFGRRLAACVRAGDLVARVGGDEFAVLVEGVGSLDSATGFADKLLERMQTPITVEGAARQVGTSIGIAYSHGRADAKALMLAADQALYDAKAAGRGVWKLREIG